jgi:crotonobetainyl-CoA:carnitine CoA-transferase CaiB-like acyl-CoA transferase
VREAGLARIGFDPTAAGAARARLRRDQRLRAQRPDRDKAAYDIAGYWARSGVAGLLTSPGHHPPFQRGGMGDHTAGQSLAGGIAAALFHRERSGEGQLV